MLDPTITLILQLIGAMLVAVSLALILSNKEPRK